MMNCSEYTVYEGAFIFCLEQSKLQAKNKITVSDLIRN